MRNDAAATATRNAIFVIAPYWHHGTWVFDDPRVGLHQEPFVSGVPEILDELVAKISDAREGFRLTFSASPFPGYVAEFDSGSPEYGGVWYHDSRGRKGWLCGALFHYFDKAPEKLFLSVAPLPR